MRTGCTPWPPIPCGGGCYSMIPSVSSPNAEFIGSGRVLPSPTGSPEECKVSGETMYKEKESWQPFKNTIGLLHPVY